MLFDAHWRMPWPLGGYGSSVFPIFCGMTLKTCCRIAE